MLLFILYMTVGVYANEMDSEEIFANIVIQYNYVSINCYGESLDNVSFPWAAFSYSITEAEIIDCAPPKKYSSALKKLSNKLINISHLSLIYYSNSTSPSFEATYFENLEIETLAVCNYAYSPKIQINSPDFLKSLIYLRELRLVFIDAPILPDNRLNSITYRHGKSLGPIGGCQELIFLSMFEWNIDLVPQNWLQNCTNLKKLVMMKIRSFSPEKLKTTIEGIKSLKYLSVINSSFTEIPTDILNELHDVEELNFAANILKNVSLGKINMRSLSKLLLAYCEITELQGLPKIQVPMFEIILNKNNIETWRLEKSDYEMLVTKNITVKLGAHDFELHIDCDCQHAWLIRALQENYIIAPKPKLKCLSGAMLKTIPLHAVECDKFECGECTCQRQWSDNTTVARCSGEASRMPRVRGLHALHAAGNQIGMLSEHDLPQSLLVIDLSNNRLSNLDGNTTKVLFSVKERRLWLRGNPLACHCANLLLIEALQTYHSQVMDYESLECIKSGKKTLVRHIVLSEVCAQEKKQQWQVLLSEGLAVCIVLLVIAAVTGVMYWQYGQHIKVYLHARGYCMWWLREEVIDDDRPYDAFLTFAQSDELFVLQELLPILDTEYKLCLHFRDWVLGELISAQITSSMEQSRRTIIVLSKNFDESEWEKYEFRTACIRSLQAYHARLIVIVLGDELDNEDLTAELRGYIRNITYLRWGDKWFWQKLRYAMPHKTQEDVPNHHNNSKLQ